MTIITKIIEGKLYYCKKVIYATPEEALQAIKEQHGKRKARDYYKCNLCEMYHLTSKGGILKEEGGILKEGGRQ